ncbi:MAG: hypothetical protein FWH17_07425 [Oscillospiraceae bacterium]|nr:hypothetical protein [Oscillospiraceae bacterium]
MRKSAFIIPIFSIFAGAAAFYLRTEELQSVFDPHTGLPARGAFITSSLIALSVFFLLVLAMFSIIAAIRYRSPKKVGNAFGISSVAYPLIFILLGVIWICGTFIHLLNLIRSEALDDIGLIFCVVSVLAALCVSLCAIYIYKDPNRRSPYVLCIVPIVFMCLWLVLLYRENAANPILISYVYRCLAIAAVALGFYYTSGFIYEAPSPGKAIVAYGSSIYFCIVSLADNLGVGTGLIFCSYIIISVIHLAMLLRRLTPKRRNVQNDS